MNNVWSGPDWRIECGDCLERLRALPDMSVEAIVTDPPYGLGDVLHRPGFTPGNVWGTLYGGGAPVWDKDTNQDAIDQCLRVAKTLIVWGGHYYRLPTSRGWLVWDRIAREWTSGHCDLAWSNLDQPVRAFSCPMGNAAFDNNKVHPTQKPLSLMRWCVSFLSEGVTVLDPFMGSATTGVACLQTGRKFIGFELDRKYCELGARRLADVAPLFRPPSEPQKGAGLFAREEA